jgi:hypothetical protein
MRFHHDSKRGKGIQRGICGLCLAVLIVAWPAVARSAEEQGLVKFRWAFGALKQDGADMKLETIGTSTSLKTGDQLKMMVERESDCYVYVIHHSSQNTIRLLFPYTLTQLADDYLQQKKYYIPQTDRWFELDQHSGPETFYLVASATRLDVLERLLDHYERAEAPNKADIVRQILDEIRTLKKQHRELASAAERPETIGGAVRGFEKAQGMNRPDVSIIARDISAPGFVARTFTIEHQ